MGGAVFPPCYLPGAKLSDWFQIEKESIKAVYYHPPYLTYIQSTSWETLG